ncbi:uncharacterized protein LOC142635608 [Castanea sativa]|uniref:uncharacterized protein LOC142635608 n=1 Tax=Castanea sativa TaxID=21020 RepID=UPI003F652F9D
MNILCWNCRGLENPQTEQELGDIRAQGPSVVFLAETWLDKTRLTFIRDKLKFKVDTYSPNHIDAIINKGNEGGWRFTGFYGEPDTRNHYISWATLRRLKSKYSLPWLCAGDYNEITGAHEKYGGRLRPCKQMEDFRDVLDECGFQDLGFKGNKFTWCNGQGEGHTVWERLDRAVGSVDWLDMFSASKVVHLESGTLRSQASLDFLSGRSKEG